MSKNIMKRKRMKRYWLNRNLLGKLGEENVQVYIKRDNVSGQYFTLIKYGNNTQSYHVLAIQKKDVTKNSIKGNLIPLPHQSYVPSNTHLLKSIQISN